MEKKMIDFCCGDCSTILPSFPDNFVDLTVTSSPYEDLRKYKGFSWNFQETARQLFRVTKRGGVVVWVIADKTKNGSESGESFRQALFFKDIGFNLHDTMIYQRWSGPLTHPRYEQEFEYMFVFSKGRPKTFNPIMIDSIWYGKDSDRTGQRYAIHDEIGRKTRSGKERKNINPQHIKGNVWKMKTSTQCGEHYGHPAPFPEQLAHDHIISWSNIGDLVLDPFVGSGTSAVMSKKLKRNFIGIDVSLDYLKIAKQRVKEFQG